MTKYLKETQIRALNLHLTCEENDEWRDVEIDGVVYDAQTCQGNNNVVTVTLYGTYMSAGFRYTDMNAERGSYATYQREKQNDL
jgi:hypothetical protein|tara:strand:- start:28 stop:279 length:252 start_codon:yes stop_codon:yes gene_type:complete